MKRLNSLAVLAFISITANATEVMIGPPGRVSPDTVMRDAITLTNHGKESVKFQARAMLWSQDSGTNAEVSTREILISPALVEIPAGEKRVVRIARQKPANGKALAYRIHFNELPKPPSGSGSVAQMLTEYSLPFVYEPASAAPVQISASWQGKDLVLTNTGGRAAKITAIGPVGAKAWAPGLLGWVLPGASMRFAINANDSNIQLSVNGKPQTLQVK